MESNSGNYPEINLCELDGNKIVKRTPLVSPYGKVEKNWLPLIIDDKINFYRCGYGDNYSILRYADNKVSITREFGCDLNLSRLKGSAGPVPLNGGYLAIFHESILQGGEMAIYYHRFVMLNKDMEITGMSLPWILESAGVEFCRSILLKGNDLFLTVSIHDKDSWVYTVNLNDVINQIYGIEYFKF